MASRLFNVNPPVLDIDATAFFTATGITDVIIKIAINQLVTDLKLFGLWTKLLCIYPFVGGTASTHKWNLKDPRDLDAAYRLVFTGGWTHSTTGALPNGTTGYANTFITPSTMLSTTSTHMSYYSRTNATVSVPYEMGVLNGTNYHLLSCGRGLDALTVFFHQGFNYQSFTVMPYNGLFLGSRISSGGSGMFGYRNATLWVPGAGSGAASGTAGSIAFSIYLGAANSAGTATNFTNKECAFASIGDGLTATDALNLYTCVQKFNNLLNRSV